jgi:hypothetical protein
MFFWHDSAQYVDDGRYRAIQNVYFSTRPFRRAIEHPKHRLYANLFPWKVDVSTNHIGAYKPFDDSSVGVRVLDVYGFLIDSLC